MYVRRVGNIVRLYHARSFSTNTVSLARLGIKDKLVKAVSQGKVPQDKALYQKKREKDIMDKNSRPVTDASARSLLTDLLGRTFGPKEQIGPKTKFTDAEIETIFNNTPNLRLKYKVLGTSGNQLKQSLLIDIDVRKYLDSGEATRAKYLISLASPEFGSYSLGTLLHYHIHTEMSMNKALDTLNWFKKRGFTLNSRSLGIILGGYGSKREKLVDEDDTEISGTGRPVFKEVTYLQAEKMISIFNNCYQRQRHEVGIRHLNALLKNLTVLPFDQAVQFIDRYIPGIFNPEKNRDLNHSNADALTPDNYTFTAIFKICSRRGSDTLKKLKFSEILFSKIQRLRGQATNPDATLVQTYASVMWNVNDIVIMMRALRVMRDWFLVCKKEDIQKKDDISKLLPKQIATMSQGSLAINPNFKDPNYQLDIENLPEEIYGFLVPLDEVNFSKQKRFPVSSVVAEKYYKISDFLGNYGTIIFDENGKKIPNTFRHKQNTKVSVEPPEWRKKMETLTKKNHDSF